MSIKPYLGQFFGFLKEAFKDNGTPSSSRLLSAWLSVSSMALIWWMVRHMMTLPITTLQAWIGGLPGIIFALATFAASPYGVNRLTGMFKKDNSSDTDKQNDPDKEGK